MDILFSTAYLPPAGFFAGVAQADEILIEVFETFTKQTGRNHCLIYGPNGRQKLTIPVVRVNGNRTKTKDIRISNHQPWQKIHWRSIETAYNNSPFFLYYMDYFVPFYNKDFHFLIEFNLEILQVLLKILMLERPIRLSSGFEIDQVNMINMRSSPGLKMTDKPGNFPSYTQVFEPRHGFIAGLSIVDVLFNLGPETPGYIKKLAGAALPADH